MGGLADSARLPLVVGAGVLAVATASFAGLVDGVSEKADLASYDPGITSWFAGERFPAVTLLAQAVTAVGSEAAIGLLTLVATAFLWFRRRDRARAVLFVVTMGAAAALTLAVKHLLARHRPAASFVVGPVDHGYSFPSGHTLFSTVFLGLLAMLVIWPVARRVTRAWVVVGWALASGTIGVTRIYLGYHWTTDVVAGWVLGVGVLAVALVASIRAASDDDVEVGRDARPAR